MLCNISACVIDGVRLISSSLAEIRGVNVLPLFSSALIGFRVVIQTLPQPGSVCTSLAAPFGSPLCKASTIQVTGMTIDWRTILPITRLRQAPYFIPARPLLFSRASESSKLDGPRCLGPATVPPRSRATATTGRHRP